MDLKPAHPASTDYTTSQVELELTCECHPTLYGGIAHRTGCTTLENWPCYRLYPRLPEHKDYFNVLVALTPDGFRFCNLPEEHYAYGVQS